MTLAQPTVPVTVVIPVRDAADFVGECLHSVVANRPAQIVVVAGRSTDRTRDIVDAILRATPHDGEGPTVEVLDDVGSGVAAARMLGVSRAKFDVVTLIDADVVLHPGSLARWYAEFREGEYAGLQAGLEPESLRGQYWGRALAEHQRISRSRFWFGLSVTMLDRKVLEDHALDQRFTSGEDIEFRHRLKRLGLRTGVSRRVLVRHRFRDSFGDARYQWREDGAGLARVVRKNGVRDAHLLGVPAAATVRGLTLTILRVPSMVAYWACFLLFNYASMLRVLFSGRALVDPGKGSAELGLAANSGALTATRVLPMVIGFGSWTFAARIFEPSAVGLAAAALSAAALVSQVAVAGHGQALVQLLPKDSSGGRRLVAVGAVVAGVGGLLVSCLLALAADSYAPQLRGVIDSTSAFLLFVGLGTATALAYYYDHVAVARRRSDLALIRSLLQSACLLGAVLVGWLASLRVDGLLVLMVGATAGVAGSTLVGLFQEARRVQGGRGSPRRQALRDFGRSGAPNFALTLAHRTPMFALPFLITEMLSPASNAAWYVAWMMSMAVWFVPNSVGYSLQARLARPGLTGGQVRAEITGALRSAAALTLVAAGAVALLGPMLLRIMGPVYETATGALWLLCVAVLPAIFSEVWLAVCRVQQRWALPIVTYLVLAVSVLAGSLSVADTGLAGVAGLWLGAQFLAGLIALLALRADRRAVQPATALEPSAAEVTS